MKFRTLHILLAAILTTFFVSCSSKSNIPVPEDAAFVLHINGASLSSKLPWDEIKQSELFKTAMEEAKDSLAVKILNNPAESGVNINADTYVFTKTIGRSSYTAVVSNLLDIPKFETFLKQIIKGKKIESKDDISFIANNDNLISWKKDRLVIIGDMSGLNSRNGQVAENLSADSLFLFAKDIYNLKKSKSIGNDSKFADLIKEEGDIHLWVNAGSLYGGAIPSVLAITKAGLLFKGNITTATLNFEDGKITYKGKNYFNKELSDLYKKNSPKEFDEATLQKIPAGKIDAMFAFSYPPEGIKDLLSLLGVDGLLNVFLAQSNISIDDFINANKGEILFSVSDFKLVNKEKKMSYGDEKDEEFTYKSEEPSANILFATSVKQKTSFEKLMNTLTETLSKEGGSSNDFMRKIPYVLSDDWFVAGNDSLSVHSFGSTNTNHDFISKIKGHPMGGYINIQSFINGAKNSLAKDSTAASITERSLQTWKDVVFYGGEYKNGGVATYAELNMVDSKTNSLKQLNNYLGFIAKRMRDQEKKRRDSYGLMDNVDTPESPKEK